MTAVTFVEREGKTTITVRWTPENATESERKTFDRMHASMQQGWTGTFDSLDEYLKRA